MNIRKAMQIDKAANSDVKLTKAGEKYSTTTDTKEIEKVLNSKKINLNEWIGLALNPIITSEQIRIMFKSLKDMNADEKDDKSIPAATKTKNMGLRGKIRGLLSEHPNLDDDGIKSLLLGSRMGKPKVFQNQNLKDEHLQLYFDKRVMTVASGEYSFLSFQQLMSAKNLNQPLVLKWYNTLLKFADWSYTDNEWYAVVDALLGWEDCPKSILEDIAKAPIDGNEGWRSKSERYRSEAVKHKNSDEGVMSLAYDVTEDVEYLSDDVKDLFIF